MHRFLTFFGSLVWLTIVTSTFVPVPPPILYPSLASDNSVFNESLNPFNPEWLAEHCHRSDLVNASYQCRMEIYDRFDHKPQINIGVSLTINNDTATTSTSLGTEIFSREACCALWKLESCLAPLVECNKTFFGSFRMHLNDNFPKIAGRCFPHWAKSPSCQATTELVWLANTYHGIWAVLIIFFGYRFIDHQLNHLKEEEDRIRTNYWALRNGEQLFHTKKYSKFNLKKNEPEKKEKKTTETKNAENGEKNCNRIK